MTGWKKFPICDLDGLSHDPKDHCEDGIHCVGQDAACAASMGVDDHSDICCFCSVVLRERA